MVDVNLNPIKGVPEFDVSDTLVHNDLPSQADLIKAEKDMKMIISFLVLPEWVDIWELDRKTRDFLEELFLRGRGLQRSHYHAVFFSIHGSDTKKQFENYKEKCKKDVTSFKGFTMLGGANVQK